MKVVPDRAWGIMTVRGEAAGEPYEGKLAVAETIRRRMRTRYASKGSAVSTVLHPQQFSIWNTTDPGRINAALADDDDEVTRDCIRAWDESEFSNVVPGAVLYHADYVKPVWVPKVRLVAQIHRHLFYADPVLDDHPNLEVVAHNRLKDEPNAE